MDVLISTVEIEMSEEGEAFKEHILSLLTKTFFTEEGCVKTREYLESEPENGKFAGKDTAGILETLGIRNQVCRFEVSEVDGCRCLTFSQDEDEGPIIMYIHGGAYVFGYTDIYFRFNEILSRECGAKVVSPIYDLASFNRKGVCDRAYGQLVSVYLALIEEHRPIYLMGDSSGGAMAVRLWQILHGMDVSEPEGLILLSPFVDATFSTPVEPDLAARDITVDMYGLREYAQLWAGDRELSDPVVSPLFGGFDGIPKTMIITSTDEIFLPSNRDLAHMIDRAGSHAELIECRGSYHIFPVYSELPESKKTMEYIRSFCCTFPHS